MIYIIGAGPMGCYAAYLLGKKKAVRVFEEHGEIGKPVQCAGITTSRILRFLPENADFIKNRIKTAEIVSPDSSSLRVRFRKADVILDRERFDRFFYNRARQRKINVRFNLGHRLVKITERSLVFLKSNGKRVSYPLKKGDVVIGADGPKSLVGEFINYGKKQRCFLGWQLRLKAKHDNKVRFFPEKSRFAWAFPESKDVVRAGIFGRKLDKEHFQRFLEKTFPDHEKRRIDQQAGLIPVHDPKRKVFRRIRNKRRHLRIYAIGDAGGFVKATSGGGLVQGLRSASIMKKSIMKNSDFNREAKKVLGRELWLHLLAHRVFARMKRKEWDDLVHKMDDKKIKGYLSRISRDNFIGLATKIVIRKPSLLRYLLKLF